MHKQLTKGEQETCVLRETLKVELPPQVETGQASGCNTSPALTRFARYREGNVAVSESTLTRSQLQTLTTIKRNWREEHIKALIILA
jgi:hypothetical protein